MATTGSERTVTVARCWYGAILVVVLFSFAIQLTLLVSGGADANSGERGGDLSLPVRLWRLLSYFTIESNIAVAAVSALLVVDPLRESRLWQAARLNALLAITITGLVFAIVLAPQVHLTGWALVATIGFHYVSPWASVLAWLVLGPRPRFTWQTVAGAFVLPIAWLAYIFTQGAFTDWYPYPFLDVTEIGLGAALRNAFLVLVLGLVIAALLKTLDARLSSLLGRTTADPAEDARVRRSR